MSRDIKFIGKNGDETVYEDFITERSDNGGSDAESIIKELAFNFIPDRSSYDDYDSEYCWDTWDVKYEDLMNHQIDNQALNLIQNAVNKTGADHILFQFF